MKSSDLAAMRQALSRAADERRANSKLAAVQDRRLVLGLMVLAYAEHRFDELRPELDTRANACSPMTREKREART